MHDYGAFWILQGQIARGEHRYVQSCGVETSCIADLDISSIKISSVKEISHVIETRREVNESDLPINKFHQIWSSDRRAKSSKVIERSVTF